MSQSGSLPSCKDRVSLADVLADNSYEFQINEDDAKFYEDDTENRVDQAFDFGSLQEQINFECIETSDPTATPFEDLEKKMTETWPNGMVKKRILKEGTVAIPEDATVWVHYNCYTEMEEVPFDSTYLRSKHPIRFKLGNGSLFVGFEIALVSMTVGEKAQFLIHPDLAFGELGSLGRIPPNATILLIAEVIRLDTSPEEEPLSVQDRKDFSKIYQKAKIMNFEANNFFKDQNMFRAISTYRKAESLLMGCSMNCDEEETKFKHLLLKIYGNMAICYNSTPLNCPKKVCIAVRKAYEIDPKNASKNAKLFYNRGVAYIALSDYKLALKDLRSARRLVPGDEDVKKQIKILEQRMKSFKEFEVDYSARALGFTRTSVDDIPPVPDTIDDDCKVAVSRLLEDFTSELTNDLNLVSEYTVAEREWLKIECDRLKLKYRETVIGCDKCEVTIAKYHPESPKNLK